MTKTESPRLSRGFGEVKSKTRCWGKGTTGRGDVAFCMTIAAMRVFLRRSQRRGCRARFLLPSSRYGRKAPAEADEDMGLGEAPSDSHVQRPPISFRRCTDTRRRRKDPRVMRDAVGPPLSARVNGVRL